MTGSSVDALAVVPARGGSRGIPGKNGRLFLGKPLLAWAVEAALASGVARRVVVSTDDPGLAELGLAAGAEVPFLRPARLASDAAATAPVIRHAVRSTGWDGPFVMVVEPTSPGRRSYHLREAVELLAESGADSVASVSRIPHHYLPSKALAFRADGRIEGADGTPVAAMRHRRQELEEAFAFDGIVFACRSELVLRDPPTLWGADVLGYRVDRRFSIDLDDPEDWEPAETRVRILLDEEGDVHE